jgi:hypothetical protein
MLLSAGEDSRLQARLPQRPELRWDFLIKAKKQVKEIPFFGIALLQLLFSLLQQVDLFFLDPH